MFEVKVENDGCIMWLTVATLAGLDEVSERFPLGVWTLSVELSEAYKALRRSEGGQHG